MHALYIIMVRGRISQRVWLVEYKKFNFVVIIIIVVLLLGGSD